MTDGWDIAEFEFDGDKFSSFPISSLKELCPLVLERLVFDDGREGITHGRVVVLCRPTEEISRLLEDGLFWDNKDLSPIRNEY